MASTTTHTSESETSISSGETYHLRVNLVCNFTNDRVRLDLGTIDLSPTTQPDFVRIAILDKDKLAELEITLERFYGYLKVNQQNYQGMWKHQEEKYNLRDFFADGVRGHLIIWAKDDPVTGLKVYVVETPKKRITTGIQ
ncbi:hypothetical protein TWF730_003328 [Orbilia blumenaviensis]|uniref:Uncharacterized protein n=1 Tax=Orbilia blumenaviensis TaxID=1796055 RepID=A0AAV9U908_9PEZI